MDIQEHPRDLPVGDEPKTCSMATVALVLSIIPICGLSQLVGIILGIVSLGRIKDSGGRLKGKGKATAAIVVGAILLVIVPIVAILAGMLLPALARAREEARRAACKQNMAQIGKALSDYEMNEGHLPTTGKPGEGPASLSLLHPKYFPQLRVFRCPSSELPVEAMSAALTNENCSYEYDNMLPPDAPANRMMLWDKDGNHYGGRNVLFRDGHVEWMTGEAFQRLLMEQGRVPLSPGPSAVPKQPGAP